MEAKHTIEAAGVERDWTFPGTFEGTHPLPSGPLAPNGVGGDLQRRPRGPAKPRGASKARVYALLREGASVAEVERALGLSNATVAEHALGLVRAGALVVTRKRARGVLVYARGPRAADFEAQPAWSTFGPHDQVAEATIQAPTVPKVRVHRGAWAFPLRWPPHRDTPWDRTWSPYGADEPAADFAMTVEGVRFWMKKNADAPDVLVVQLPEAFVDASDVMGAAEARRDLARETMHGWCAQHGARADGAAPREVAPVEYALALPGLLARAGRPGASRWWIDGSPGGGVLEVETQEAGLARRMASTWIEADGAPERRTNAVVEMLRGLP